MSRLWSGLCANLVAGAKLALFMPVRALDFRITAGHYAMLVGASFAAWLVGGMLRGGFPGTVNAGALIVGLGQLPLVLLVCLLAATLLRDASLTLALAVLITATDPLFELIAVLLYHVSQLAAAYAGALSLIFVAWGAVVLLRAQHAAAGWRGLRSVGAGTLLVGLLALLILVFPRAELWNASREPEDEPPRGLMQEEVFHLQGRLLDTRLADLEPERPGVQDVYFVGVAGDAGQDALIGEVDAVRAVMDDRIDTAGRSLVLANNAATLESVPLASATNLADALGELGDTINPEEDIVFLYLASSSSPQNELAFNMPPLELRAMNPTMLARTLADSGIKWRVIFISACYSGGFIEPLKDENSLIVTASDAAQASPACARPNERSWFSRAYFDEALRSTRSLVDAFNQARAKLAEREHAAGYQALNPQIHLGAAMKEKLESLQKRLESGDPNRPSVRASR